MIICARVGPEWCWIFFFFLPLSLLQAVVCYHHGDQKAVCNKEPEHLSLLFSPPSLLSLRCQSLCLSLSPSRPVLHLSQVCLISHLVAFLPTSYHRCRGSHGNQRSAKWQPANIQAGGGGGWWCREERPHHPILPEDLCARLRSHDRGLVSKTHGDRRTVGDTGWWVGNMRMIPSVHAHLLFYTFFNFPFGLQLNMPTADQWATILCVAVSHTELALKWQLLERKRKGLQWLLHVGEMMYHFLHKVKYSVCWKHKKLWKELGVYHFKKII